MFPADGTTGWQASPASSVTATANSLTSPDGTTNATKLATGDTLNNGHIWFKTYTGAINTAYVGSVYLKAGEYTRAQVNFGSTGFASLQYGALFDLSNGTVVATAGGSTITITAVGNGWYRCTVTGTSDADGGNYVLSIVPAPSSVTTIGGLYTPASVGLGIYVYGIQVEAGAFATSLIPTVASQVTRNADNASMTGTNFSSWYNQSEGTIVVSAAPIVSAVAKYPFSFNDGTNNELIAQYFINNNAGWFVVDGGVSQVQIEATPITSVSNVAVAYQLNNFAISLNGGSPVTDVSGTIPTVTQAQIGNRTDGTRNMNGYIRSITYYATRLTNAQLQALTA
jgi:hypothetical protein